jgi:integrase
MEKRFHVKRFLFETTTREVVWRFMLTDRLLPMLAPNQYIEMKSVNKLGTGKSHAYKLCVFFNFLHEKYHINYDVATNRQVLAFIDHFIYGDRENLRILDSQDSVCYSTLSGYVSAITDFYRWLDQTYGSEMVFYEGERRCRPQSYLYGQIYTYKYKYLIDRVLPDVKGSREYIKWYTDEEKEQLCSKFNTLRDETVFRLTLEGFRIDETLSMRLADYHAAERLIQPSRSKRRQSASTGHENKLRTVRISKETAKVLNEYLFMERPSAENASGTISDWIFLILRGSSVGQPLSYHNFRKILKSCAERCGLEPEKIKTHSGRSTKVMEVLENNTLHPEDTKSDIQIKALFGWSSIDSITPYMNHNSEIMANAAYKRHKKGGESDD